MDLKDYQQQRKALLGEIEERQKRVAAIDAAIAMLDPKRHLYETIGLTEAAERYLVEVGRPADTAEIAHALRDRGVQSKTGPGRPWVRNVYATLHMPANRGRFARKNGKWILVKKK